MLAANVVKKFFQQIKKKYKLQSTAFLYRQTNMKLLKQYCFETFCKTKTLSAWTVKPAWI